MQLYITGDLYHCKETFRWETKRKILDPLDQISDRAPTENILPQLRQFQRKIVKSGAR